MEILPGKVVMVKKPIGDGTHLKKGRVVVCGNFQQVQPGEETCANTPSFPMLRTKGHLRLKCSPGPGGVGVLHHGCFGDCSPNSAAPLCMRRPVLDHHWGVTRGLSGVLEPDGSYSITAVCGFWVTKHRGYCLAYGASVQTQRQWEYCW